MVARHEETATARRSGEEELLRGCFKGLRSDAAAGIDKMTKEMYAENLEANLSELIERLQRMAYKPQPVRRKYIPKPGSTKQRPLMGDVLHIYRFTT